MSIKQTVRITFRLFQHLSHTIIIEIIENNNSVFYENNNIMNYCKNNEKKSLQMTVLRLIFFRELIVLIKKERINFPKYSSQ